MAFVTSFCLTNEAVPIGTQTSREGASVSGVASCKLSPSPDCGCWRRNNERVIVAMSYTLMTNTASPIPRRCDCDSSSTEGSGIGTGWLRSGRVGRSTSGLRLGRKSETTKGSEARRRSSRT